MDSKPSYRQDIDASYSGVVSLIDSNEHIAEMLITRCATDIVKLERTMENLNKHLVLLQQLKDQRRKAILNTMKHINKEFPAVIVGERDVIMVDISLNTNVIPLNFIKKRQKQS